jgi:hypothetical protein
LVYYYIDLKIKVSVLYIHKLSPNKIDTILIILKEDPVAVELFARVTANGCPAEIEVFPKRPEVIVVFEINDSPSENC